MPYDKSDAGQPQGATAPTAPAGKSPSALVTLNEEQRTKMLDMVFNVEFSRRRLMNMMLDPRRDISDECGWPKTNPTPQDYYDLYDRDSIAARVVELWPKESWKVTPEVYESEEDDAETAFETSFKEFVKGLKPERSFFKDNHLVLWEYLERLDILSGIGRYGVLLLGFNDVVGDDLSQPVKASANLKVNFLRVFPESLAYIASYETQVSSERFGLPTSYNLTFHDPKDDLQGIGTSTTTRAVHWTRIIHVPSDGAANSSEFVGRERMRPVLNDVLDARKIRGAFAEGYWKSCFTILTAETHPALGGDVEVNKSEMKDMFEEMMNGLQRHGVLEGMTLKSTAPNTVDPTPFVDKCVEAICIKIEVPVPVFKGYEIGEQASTENKTLWNNRVQKRQWTWVTPRVIAPLIDRLITFGILAEPAESYCIEWPDLNAMSDKDKSDIALRVTQAVSQYVTSGASGYMTFADFCVKVLGWTADEAEQYKENVNAEMTEDEDNMSAMVAQPQGLAGLIELFKAAHEGAVSEEQLKQVMVLFFGLTEEQAETVIADGLPPTSADVQADQAEQQAKLNPEPAKPASNPNAAATS